MLQTWPLTRIRRYRAASNKFTLDFGNYSDANYSVATNEGMAISQALSEKIGTYNMVCQLW